MLDEVASSLTKFPPAPDAAACLSYLRSFATAPSPRRQPASPAPASPPHYRPPPPGFMRVSEWASLEKSGRDAENFKRRKAGLNDYKLYARKTVRRSSPPSRQSAGSPPRPSPRSSSGTSSAVDMDASPTLLTPTRSASPESPSTYRPSPLRAAAPRPDPACAMRAMLADASNAELSRPAVDLATAYLQAPVLSCPAAGAGEDGATEADIPVPPDGAFAPIFNYVRERFGASVDVMRYLRDRYGVGLDDIYRDRYGVGLDDVYLPPNETTRRSDDGPLLAHLRAVDSAAISSWGRATRDFESASVPVVGCPVVMGQGSQPPQLVRLHTVSWDSQHELVATDVSSGYAYAVDAAAPSLSAWLSFCRRVRDQVPGPLCFESDGTAVLQDPAFMQAISELGHSVCDPSPGRGSPPLTATSLGVVAVDVD